MSYAWNIPNNLAWLFSQCFKVSYIWYTLIPTMTKKEKIFYMQPVVSHQDNIVHRGITECLVLTLACLQQNTEHSPPSIHKRTDLHDVIFLLTSNILLIPVLEILFFKESSKGSSHPKGEKNPHQNNHTKLQQKQPPKKYKIQTHPFWHLMNSIPTRNQKLAFTWHKSFIKRRLKCSS